MDPKQFDRLARIVGLGSSRRGVLKTLARGTFGAVMAAIGLSQADASTRKRSAGNSCNVNADCASNLCVQESRTRKICHCVTASDCPVSNGLCQTSACLQSGYCSATSVVCQPLDACHLAGTCNPSTGACSNPSIICQSGHCDPVAGCVACLQDSDCPTTGNECIVPICVNHACTTTNLGTSHTLSTGQTAGDCQKKVCNGAGGITSINDPTDLPTSSSVCLINPACSGSPLAPSFTNAPTGTPCGGGNDCLNGVCVACYSDGTACTVAGQCCSNTCAGNVCTTL